MGKFDIDTARRWRVPRVSCLACLAVIKARDLEAHFERGECLVNQTVLRMKARGWVNVEVFYRPWMANEVPHELAPARVEWRDVYVHESDTTRAALVPVNGLWVPQWACAVLTLARGQSSNEALPGVTRKHALHAFARMKDAARPARLQQYESIVRLGGRSAQVEAALWAWADEDAASTDGAPYE